MPTTFANTIDGNEILAKRSQCDYAGNDIQTTYATKSEVTTGLASKQDTLSAGNGIDITNNVVSADLDGTSLTNGANGLSVTLPVPDTTGASQGDVLSVGQSGIEWVTPGGGGGDDAVLTYNVSTWSDFTTAYNAGKNIRVVETVNGTTYEAVLFEYNPNGSPNGYAKFTATILRNGVGAVSSNWYQISNIGSGVWTRGAGTIQGNYSGQGAISVSSDTHMISLTLDGSSLAQSSSGLAVANPLPSTLGTAGQVLQVNSGATGVEWATPSGGSVTDVEVNGTSVVNASGVAEVTVPAQVQPDWDATSGLGEILNKPTIPTETSDLTNDSGFITLSDVPAQVNADWNAVSGAAEILNKPTIPAAQVNSDWNAASGVAQILNKPDLSQYATQTDLAGKEDAFDVGTGLEMDTSGATPTLQVEAPVDIVAGTGIAIDNPDGNTMRITNTGFPISATDAVLCGTFRGDPMYTKTYTFTGTVGTSETTISMSIDEKKGTNNVNRIWIDPSTSFILYGSAGNNILPLSWRLGSSRQGSVAVLGASTGSLSCRCVDTSSTPITLNITIRYTVSNS